MLLLHVTPKRFKAFSTQRPVFFWPDIAPAEAMQRQVARDNGQAFVRTALLSGAIADRFQALDVWNSVNERADFFLYSMLCHATREFTDQEIKRFVTALVESGFNRVRQMEDEMTKFNETDEGLAFIASGDSRETSKEIMEAIAFFARNTDEAEALWNGDGLGQIANPSDIFEHATGNGLRDATDYVWGAAGSNWAAEIGALPPLPTSSIGEL